MVAQLVALQAGCARLNAIHPICCERTFRVHLKYGVCREFVKACDRAFDDTCSRVSWQMRVKDQNRGQLSLCKGPCPVICLGLGFSRLWVAALPRNDIGRPSAHNKSYEYIGKTIPERLGQVMVFFVLIRLTWEGNYCTGKGKNRYLFRQTHSHFWEVKWCQI